MNAVADKLVPIRRIADALTSAGVVGASAALAAIVVAYCYEVVSRYVFDSPTIWASDLVALLLCLAVFLMIPEVARNGGHISVTLLEERLGSRWRERLRMIIAIASAVVCFAAAAISGLENVRQFVAGVTTVSVYPIPKWLLSSAITYGLGLSGLQFLLAIVRPGTSGEDRLGGFS